MFRVVPEHELRDHDGRPADPRKGDLRHLREQGLVRPCRCLAAVMASSF